MRLILMPPAVEPDDAPMAIRMARTRNAPDENPPAANCDVVTFWKPVVVNAANTMNKPRRSMLGRFENKRLPESDAARTITMRTIQAMRYLTSVSSKTAFTRPRITSACSVKLIDPSSITMTRINSMDIEW